MVFPNLGGVDDHVAGGGDDEEEVGEVDQPGLVQGDRGGGQGLGVQGSVQLCLQV